MARLYPNRPEGLFYFYDFSVAERVPGICFDVFAVNLECFPLFDVVVIVIFDCDHKDCAKAAFDLNFVSAN